MKEQENQEKIKLENMKETISWIKPRKIALLEKYNGKESKEKEIHSKRIFTKIGVFYAREEDIPK
jgi:hypothetical protein